MKSSDPLSEFVHEGRKETERASVVMRKESGDSGFCLKAKGGKKAIDKLVKILNEAV
jgi:hypothetical protein